MLSDEEIKKYLIPMEMAQKDLPCFRFNELIFDVDALLQAQEQATRKEIGEWLEELLNDVHVGVAIVGPDDIESLSEGEMPHQAPTERTG